MGNVCQKSRADDGDAPKPKAANKRTITILFGAPGAGKGTQAPKISAHLQVPTLSTGDMLRAAVSSGTEEGKKAEALMASGELVPDDLVIDIVKRRILDPDCAKGFILDGFPRTVQQAEVLDGMLEESGERVGCVLELQVPDTMLEERICGRWIHKSSGRSFHTKFAPPKGMQLGEDGLPVFGTMVDDETNEPLCQRPDDTAEALRIRLEAYHSTTSQILTHYMPRGVVRTVNANQDIEAVWSEVVTALRNSASTNA